MKSHVGFVILAISFIAFGCVDEPLPNFTFSPSTVDVGQEVVFKNASFKAVRYEWDFGDSTFATVPNPTKSYDTPGTYKVTMTAFNKSEVSGAIAKNITVGVRHAQLVTINSMPTTDSAGNPWDANDDPDLQFALRPVGFTSWSMETVIDQNVSSIPYTFDVSTVDLDFTVGDWEFELRDNDVATNQIIASGTFHPYDDGSNQHIILSGTDWEIDIMYAAK